MTTKRELAEALLAEAVLEEELAVAKAAYRADPSDVGLKAAKAAVIARLVEARNAGRAGRKGPQAVAVEEGGY